MMASSIIGAGTAAIGAGLSALGGARAARAKRRELAKQERDNNSWFDQKYNELGTERADAQAALSAMRQAQQQRMQSARGAGAVMGASAGSVAAEKAGANMAMGQTLGEINRQADALRGDYEKTYLAKRDAISNARIAAAEAQSQNIAAAGSQLSSLGSNMMGKKL